MNPTMKKMTCRALVVSLLALSFQTANGTQTRDLPPGPKDISMIRPIMEEFGIQLQLPPGSH